MCCEASLPGPHARVCPRQGRLVERAALPGLGCRVPFRYPCFVRMVPFLPLAWLFHKILVIAKIKHKILTALLAQMAVPFVTGLASPGVICQEDSSGKAGPIVQNLAFPRIDEPREAGSASWREVRPRDRGTVESATPGKISPLPRGLLPPLQSHPASWVGVSDLGGHPGPTGLTSLHQMLSSW